MKEMFIWKKILGLLAAIDCIDSCKSFENFRFVENDCLVFVLFEHLHYFVVDVFGEVS